MILRTMLILTCMCALAVGYTDFDAAIWQDDEGTTKEGSLVLVDNRFGSTVLEGQLVQLTSLAWEDRYDISGGNPWTGIPYYTGEHVIVDGIEWALGTIAYGPDAYDCPTFGPIAIYESVEKDEWGLPLIFGEIEGGVGPGHSWGCIVGGKHFHSPATAEIGGEEYVDSDPGQNIFELPVPEPATLILLMPLAFFRRHPRR